MKVTRLEQAVGADSDDSQPVIRHAPDLVLPGQCIDGDRVVAILELHRISETASRVADL